MMSLAHTDSGWITRITDMCGSPQWKRVLNRMPLPVIGCLLNSGGPGCRIIIGVGRLFIMAAGCTMIITDGYGSRRKNGAPPGWHGGDARVTMAGHQWGRVFQQVW